LTILYLTLLGCQSGAHAAEPRAAAAAPATVPAAAQMTGTIRSIQLPEVASDLPEGPGRVAVQNVCASCHTPHYVMIQPPLTRETWTAEVTKMQKSFSAPVPPESVEEIVNYLVQVRGTK
jgi:mono/diheme cytochrome c family protein